jgi:hypothetical protein
MNLLRKLTLASVGLAFVLGLSVIETNAQWGGRYYGNRGYSRGYVRYQPRYGSYYGYRRYRPYYRRGGYGLSWRERRILAHRRARMMRATRRYYRTRNRILNRRTYRNAYYSPYRYRNY